MTYYVSPVSLSVIFIDIDTISQLMHSSTGFRRTRIMVTKLIRLTVETGLVTGIFSALSTAVTKLTRPTFSDWSYP